jgi:hypothetical protein
MATFPPARRSAMIPDPTTVASKKNVPSHSDISLRIMLIPRFSSVSKLTRRNKTVQRIDTSSLLRRIYFAIVKREILTFTLLKIIKGKDHQRMAS